ncbi:hypothetical protein V8F20_012655 [Naviculisporaceae sp. PSN 640]
MKPFQFSYLNVLLPFLALLFTLPSSYARNQTQTSVVELRDTCAAESCIGLAINSACIVAAVAKADLPSMLSCVAGQISAFCDCADCLPDEVQNFVEEKRICSASEPIQKVADSLTGKTSSGVARKAEYFRSGAAFVLLATAVSICNILGSGQELLVPGRPIRRIRSPNAHRMDSTPTVRQYRIFNDEVFPSRSPSRAFDPPSFDLFPRLPPELRLLVWKHCLPETAGRLVSLLVSRRVFVDPRFDPNDTRRWTPVRTPDDEIFTRQNALGNIVSGFPYALMGIQDCGQLCNALRRVNREARDVYLAKYRLPIEICTEDQDSRGYTCYRYTTLRLDPDNDVVELTRYWGRGNSFRLNAGVFLYVLHDFVANDPRGQGIAHLAMGADCNDVSQLAALHREGIRPIVRQSISQFFSHRLKSFYSVISRSSEARNMLGSFSSPQGPYHNNRSIPIGRNHNIQRTVEFALFPQDPRPIERDLPHMAVGTDPKMNVYLWYHLLAKLGVPVDPVPPMQIRYLMGLQLRVWEEYKRPHHMVLTREKFMGDLRDLDEGWGKSMATFGPHLPKWGEVFGSGEEYQKSLEELADVAGVWVLDPETFGEIGYNLAREDPAGNVHWGNHPPYKPKMVVDLSKQRRPGLMVFRFSDEKTDHQ